MIPWRREWLPNPVFLPRKFYGQRSLVGCSVWSCKESDTTEHYRCHHDPLKFWICSITWPQFVVIHTVKGFSIVNKAEVDVFLESPCFFYDPTYLGNLISGSSAFINPVCIWTFSVHVLLKPGLEDFEHDLASECCCSSVSQSCRILCEPMDCSMPGFPVFHHLLELAQTHIHWVGDTIQLSHPLSSLFPPAFNLSQHQGFS